MCIQHNNDKKKSLYSTVGETGASKDEIGKISLLVESRAVINDYFCYRLIVFVYKMPENTEKCLL